MVAGSINVCATWGRAAVWPSHPELIDGTLSVRGWERGESVSRPYFSVFMPGISVSTSEIPSDPRAQVAWPAGAGRVTRGRGSLAKLGKKSGNWPREIFFPKLRVDSITLRAMDLRLSSRRFLFFVSERSGLRDRMKNKKYGARVGKASKQERKSTFHWN